MFWNPSRINRHVQVLAIHTRLDIKSAKRLMAPQAKFIAILKDPVYSWPSGFSYFNSPALNRMPLEKFLNDAIDSMKKRKFPPWFSSNFLYFDLGFDETVSIWHSFRPGDTYYRPLCRCIVREDLCDPRHWFHSWSTHWLLKHRLRSRCWKRISSLLWLRSSWTSRWFWCYMRFVGSSRTSLAFGIYIPKKLSSNLRSFRHFAEFGPAETLPFSWTGVYYFYSQNESYPTIHPEGLDSELISKVAQLNDIDVRYEFLPSFGRQP